MSLKPAIGYGYIQRTQTYHKNTLEPLVRHQGIKQRMPRYYKLKIFNIGEQKIINRRNLERADEADAKDMANILAAGNDYFLHKQDQVKNARNKINNQLKKHKTF